MRLSRKQFVKICTDAILDTRNKIAINNQVSGYKKYHRESKEKRYLSDIRGRINRTHENEYMYRHDLIEHAGIGRCGELADFLLIEIAKKIRSKEASARIRKMVSEAEDHCYLEIKIRLADERHSSVWEVDAWDPRIIDISTRPNDTIKNHSTLDYGYSAVVAYAVFTDEIDYTQRFHFFNEVPKPIQGAPSREATPDSELLKQHPELYSDHTIEASIDEGKIDPSGRLHYLQRVSKWQR